MLLNGLFFDSVLVLELHPVFFDKLFLVSNQIRLQSLQFGNCVLVIRFPLLFDFLFDVSLVHQLLRGFDDLCLDLQLKFQVR